MYWVLRPKPTMPKRSIRIGVVAPTTGGMSKTGRDMWQAAQLAAKEINEAGGVYVEEFKANTDEEITAKAKQFCRELKESIADEVAEVIRETVEYVLENEDVFYDLVEVLKEVM